MWLATFPAVIWVDKVGRKPVLVSGAFIMAAWAIILIRYFLALIVTNFRCHLIIAILTGLYQKDWAA